MQSLQRILYWNTTSLTRNESPGIVDLGEQTSEQTDKQTTAEKLAGTLGKLRNFAAGAFASLLKKATDTTSGSTATDATAAAEGSGGESASTKPASELAQKAAAAAVIEAAIQPGKVTTTTPPSSQQQQQQGAAKTAATATVVTRALDRGEVMKVDLHLDGIRAVICRCWCESRDARHTCVHHVYTGFCVARCRRVL